MHRIRLGDGLGGAVLKSGHCACIRGGVKPECNSEPVELCTTGAAATRIPPAMHLHMHAPDLRVVGRGRKPPRRGNWRAATPGRAAALGLLREVGGVPVAACPGLCVAIRLRLYRDKPHSSSYPPAAPGPHAGAAPRMRPAPQGSSRARVRRRLASPLALRCQIPMPVAACR